MTRKREMAIIDQSPYDKVHKFWIQRIKDGELVAFQDGPEGNGYYQLKLITPLTEKEVMKLRRDNGIV